MTLLRTPRLIGRPVGPCDAGFAADLFGRPEVGRGAGESRLPWSGAEAARRASAFAAHWAAHDFGLRIWSAEGTAVALAGLQFCVIAGRGEVEASVAVLPERWGDGLGREALAAALSEAPEICRDVAAVAWSDNPGALRLLAGLGFRPAQSVRGTPARLVLRLRVGA